VNDRLGIAGVTVVTAGRAAACDDAQVLRRFGAGDEEAMAAFYREHGRIVFAQILLVAGECALAEEVLQDTMLDAAAAAGVAVTGAFILATGGLFWLDPAVALAIAAVISWHALALIRKVLSRRRPQAMPSGTPPLHEDGPISAR
jgi:hypothetical protein